MALARLLRALLLSTIVAAVSAASAPTCNGISATRRTVGYYDVSSAGTSCGIYPESINAAGYTHINVAHAYIDPQTFAIAFAKTSDPAFWVRLVTLRETNPGLQVWLSVGGWIMSGPGQPTAKIFSQLAASTANQKLFFNSLLATLGAYGFDGVDIDWQYPGVAERGGSAVDAANYAFMVAALRTTLAASGYSYGLTITLPSATTYSKNFDINQMQHSVDWFNVMNYNVNNDTLSSTTAKAHSALNDYDAALKPLWDSNVDPAKVTLGLGFLGRSYALASASCTSPGCPTSGFSNTIACDGDSGIMYYDEILAEVDAGATVTYNANAAVQLVVYGDNQWVSYDDAKTLVQKLDYANKHCLGGTNVWTINSDRDGSAITALSNTTMQLQNAALAPDLSDSVSQCQWTDCIDPTSVCPGLGGPKTGPCVQDCPAGTTTSWVSAGVGVCSGSSFRRFCCPDEDRPDTCHVRSDRQVFCNGRCSGSEVKIGTDSNGCVVGNNEVCCTRSRSVEAQQQCSWTTTCSDFAICPNSKPYVITSTPFGDGGQPCSGTQKKTLCCSDPNPYTSCSWNRGPFGGYVCQGSCSKGQVIVATTTEGCTSGSQVLCCGGVSEDATVASYKLLLASFVQDPVCSAPPADVPDGVDTVSEIDENQDLRRNAAPAKPRRRDLDAIGGFGQTGIWAAAFSSGSYRAVQLQHAWDAVIGPTNLYSYEYQDLFDTSPEMDPAVLVELWLCDWDSARLNLQNSNHAGASACTLPWNTSVLDTRDARKLNARVFHNDPATTAPTTGGRSHINTGALLERILDTTDVPFLYARIIRYTYRPPRPRPTRAHPNPRRPPGVPQVNLEVAYDLRGAPDLQERPGVDEFAVFHFHIDRFDPDQYDPSADPYPGVGLVHVFHGQRVMNPLPQFNTQPQEWRVNYGTNPGERFAGGVNERTDIWRCPPGTLWYPGDPDETNRDRIQDFGALLRAQGVMGPATIHNWDTANQRWTWDSSRLSGQMLLDLDFPNTGLVGSQFTLAPADMRPNANGGNQNFRT